MKSANWWKKCLAALLSAALISSCVGSAGVFAAGDASTGEPTLAEEFQNAPQQSRTMIRYWLPDAAVEEEEVRRDIQTIAELGYGGIEVVGLTMLTSGVTDDYRWGTENWDRAMEVVVDEAKKQGLTVDVTNGPGWPISMPGIETADDEAASYEMTYGTAVVAGGERYTGVVPARNQVRKSGTTKLFAVAAYRVAGDKTVDYGSYVDLMPSVTLNEQDPAQSTLDWTAPDGEDWMVFSFWEQPTAQQYGGKYYIVDHFGQAGAQACIDYWEQVLEEKDYLHEVSSIFNDSLEYQVDKEWTRGFQEIFEQQKGYDITPYLPVIGGTGYYQTGEGPNFSFTDPELTQRIKNDYNDVVTYCYNEYHLKPLQQMAEEHGMNIRYQVAYNKPMEVETSALSVGIPEGEGLNRATLDNLRMMASAVHMTDKQIYSFEAAAEFGNANGQSYEDMAWWLKRSWAAGMNRQVLHGASYSGVWEDGKLSGAIGGTSWPGWSGFSGFISNDWNRNTSEENASSYIEYFSRYNYIMQKESKIDVAVYRHTYEDRYMLSGNDGEDWYPDGGALNANGYSYEFVSPSILSLDTAKVTNGVLNENGPAYKAIVLANEERMSPSTLDTLTEMVEAGLKLVVVGDTPSKLMYQSELNEGYTDAMIVDGMASLCENGNVRQVADYADVPAALAALGVTADAQYSTPTDILARHQVDETGDYYYLYNYNKMLAEDANATLATAGTGYPGINKEMAFSEKDVEVTLKGEGRPYLLDGWTGEITPIASYQLNNGSVTLKLSFDEDEAKLIALLTDEEAQANGITPHSSYITALDSSSQAVYTDQGEIALRASEEGRHTATLSNGTQCAASVEEVQQSFAVGAWDLQISAIEPGEGSIYFRDSVWNQLEPTTVTSLAGWSEINPDWKNVSGIGRYTATFTLDKGWEQGYGATIALGEVEDTYTVEVNGTQLPFTNQINTTLDIGPYVHQGENTIVVTVASTLYNQFKAHGGMMSSMPLKQNGLLGVNGVVRVTPYQQVVFEADTSKEILNKVLAYAQQQYEDPSFEQVIAVVQETFTAALESARAVAADPYATQQEIDAAWQTLMTEIHKLGFVRGDKTSLATLLEVATQYEVKIDSYTPATADQFVAVLAEARETYADENAMQDDVSAAESDLLEAMMNLRYKADKGVLESVLAKASEIDLAAYTAESRAAFQSANDNARAVYEDENATQDEVNSAADRLHAAIDRLEATDAASGSIVGQGASIQGDATRTNGSATAKTGETTPVAALIAVLALAGAGLVVSKKRR